MNRSARWFVLALTLLALAALTGAALADGPISGRTGRAEVRFLEGMIDHHQMALDMANNCIERASTDEVQAICAGVIAAQTPEIVQMQTWLQEWYGIDYQPMAMAEASADHSQHNTQNSTSAGGMMDSGMGMGMMGEGGMSGMMDMMQGMMNGEGMGGMMDGDMAMPMMQMQMMMMHMQMIQMMMGHMGMHGMGMMGQGGMSDMGMMGEGGMPGMGGMQQGMPGMGNMPGMQQGAPGMGNMPGMQQGAPGMGNMQGMPGMADATPAPGAGHDAHHPGAAATAAPDSTMPGMGMGGALLTDPAMTMGMFAGLNRLTGLDYDLAWLESMIEHHDGAIRMSERLQMMSGGHEELQALAQNIITAQTAEIAQMEALIAQLGA